MARAPNYDFERRERQKEEDAKRAAKAQAKRDSKAAKDGNDPADAVPDGLPAQVDAAVARDKIQNE